MKGFTLIELIVVVAIIGLLEAVSIYLIYIVMLLIKLACMKRKYTAIFLFTEFYDQDSVHNVLPAPILSACSMITDASVGPLY